MCKGRPMSRLSMTSQSRGREPHPFSYRPFGLVHTWNGHRMMGGLRRKEDPRIGWSGAALEVGAISPDREDSSDHTFRP